MDYFNKESSFEEAFITQLQNNGWEKEVIKYPTEQDDVGVAYNPEDGVFKLMQK